MRQDYQHFIERGVEIIALGPDGPRAFKRYWAENDIPFIGCADIRSRVAHTYYQEVNLLKLGRMPALFVIDRDGNVRFEHYSESMRDIPANATVFAVIDQLQSAA